MNCWLNLNDDVLSYKFAITNYQGNIKMGGIKKLTMYSREIAFVNESLWDLRAPDFSQNLPKLAAGADGDDGKHGVHGPSGKQAFLDVEMDATCKDPFRRRQQFKQTNNKLMIYSLRKKECGCFLLLFCSFVE